MNEQDIVQLTLLEIFKANGYDDAGLMTQRNFEHISDEIEKKSGIFISGTTIRRLSKGAFSRSPQTATLHAIANYHHFDSWPAYKAAFIKQRAGAPGAAELPQATEVAEPDETGSLPKRRWKSWAYPGWITLLLATVFISGYYLYAPNEPVNHFAKASFSARKTTDNDLPNSVVFNYNVDEVTADSFFIQQSWDKNRKVRVYRNKYTLTDIYYEPGYHIAKLIANDSIIKTAHVNIPTDRWFFYANENRTAYRTEYIKTKHFIKQGSLAISSEALHQNKIDISQEKIYLYSYFPSRHDVDSDNFTLKTRVRMKEVRNTLCPYITIEVYGQYNVIMMKSTPKGCANHASLRFSELEINGKEADLTSIGYDVTQWTDVELTVRNKEVRIKIAGREAFKASYRNTVKLVTGLSFISNGLCEVDYVTLTGSDGKVFCDDRFDM
nr:hypothetical protein [uncultured Dyadobacter sp.]